MVIILETKDVCYMEENKLKISNQTVEFTAQIIYVSNGLPQFIRAMSKKGKVSKRRFLNMLKMAQKKLKNTEK